MAQLAFGRHILLERIQSGGMAEIFLACRPGVNGISKFLAVKRILPHLSGQNEFVKMFNDEARIAMQLSHANIVPIHEFGRENNQLFLAMDCIEGKNLREVLARMHTAGVSFNIDQALYVVKEAAAALDHAHRVLDTKTGQPLGIVHRDMSPQNIMISYEGDVKVIDFGIAKARLCTDTTQTGTLKGKVAYMSPEQAEGREVDERTDVFALGIILWELLSGVRLFATGDDAQTLRAVRDCQIPSLRRFNAKVPWELERIVAKALAKERALRYQTAACLQREISRYLNRRYPDFSERDVGLLMKTLFQMELIESRKRMAEYARRAPNASESHPRVAPVVLSEKTEISRASAQVLSKNLASQRGLALMAPAEIGPRLIGPAKPETRVQEIKAPGSVRLLSIFVFGLATIWPLAPRPFAVNQTQYSLRAPAPPEKVRLDIKTTPSGAELVVNDQVIQDLTPTSLELPFNSQAKVQIRLKGYASEEHLILMERNRSFRARLSPKKAR